MIQAICGTVGGGKTLYAVLQIYEALKRGAHVSTNIHLVGWDIDTGTIDPTKGMFKRLFKYRRIRPTQLQYLDFDAISNLAAVLPAGRPDSRNIVVLDEVNEWFDSVDRDKIRTDSDFRNIQRFFRQSRKVYTDIYLVLQDFNTLNNRVRTLVSHVMFSRDLANLKAGVVPIGFLLRNWFFRRLYDNQSKTLTWRSMCRKETYAYGWYDTYQTYGGAIVGGGTVGAAGEKVPHWITRLNPVWLVLVLQCLFMFWVGVLVVRPAWLERSQLVDRSSVVMDESAPSHAIHEKVITNTVVVGTSAPSVEFDVSNWKVVRELGKDVVWLYDGRRYGLGDYTEYGRLDCITDRRLTFVTTNGWRHVDWVLTD